MLATDTDPTQALPDPALVDELNALPWTEPPDRAWAIVAADEEPADAE